MNEIKLLQWRSETGLYLVAHPWLDIISQGETTEQARSAFLHSLAFEALHRVGKDGVAAFPLAPLDVAARWARASETGSSKT